MSLLFLMQEAQFHIKKKYPLRIYFEWGKQPCEFISNSLTRGFSIVLNGFPDKTAPPETRRRIAL